MAWASALAGLGGGIAALLGQDMANRENRGIASDQMNFQRDMSNTSHQRQVADLKAAGLNPILSANAGASTPQGASTEVKSALGAGLTSALETMRLKKDIGQADSQIALNETASKAQSAAAHRDAQTAKQVQQQTEILRSQAPAIKARSDLEVEQAGWDRKAIKFDNINKRIQGGLGTVNQVGDLFNPILKRHNELGKQVQPGQGKTKSGEIFDLGTGLIR